MRLRVFVSSWLFAPYTGSADIDLFKRLRHCDLDFEVVQARGRLADQRLLDFPSRATFTRHEIDVGGPPRTEAARARFIQGVVERFDPTRHQAIVSHSNEVPSHAAALELKRRWPALPWVAYFGDAVSGNPYVRHMGEYPLFEDDCFVEDQTLRRADVVVCNNTQQATLMARGVPEAQRAPMVIIPHAWEPAFSVPVSPQTGARFVFMHLGSLYPVKRMAGPVLEAVDLLLERHPSLKGRFEVIFIGDEVSDLDLQRWRRMTAPEHIRFLPGVSYLSSLDLMQRPDALLLIDGIFEPSELPESPFMPGKLADYLGTGRPILGVSMPRGPTAEYLAAAGQPVVSDQPEPIASAMKDLVEGRIAPPRPPLRLRAELIGAEFELVVRAAVGGAACIEALPRLHESLLQRSLQD